MHRFHFTSALKRMAVTAKVSPGIIPVAPCTKGLAVSPPIHAQLNAPSTELSACIPSSLDSIRLRKHHRCVECYHALMP